MIEEHQKKLDEIMSSDYANRTIKHLAMDKDVSIEVAEILFKGTIKQMIEDKNTDWEKFKVIMK